MCNNNIEQRERQRERKIRHMVIKNLPHFWLFCVLSGVVAMFIQLVGLIPPVIMQRIIDVEIPSRDLTAILSAIVWFCTIPFVSTVLSTCYKYMLAVSCRKYGQQLSLKGFYNLIKQPIGYYNHMNSSELATYCRNEAISYVVFWVIDIPQLVATIISSIIIFGYVAKLNVWISLLMLLYVPFSFLPSNYLAKKAKTFSERILDNNATMAQIITDTFKGIKFVKTMVLEDNQMRKLETVNKDTVSVWSQSAAVDNLSGLWVDDFSNTLFTGLIFALAAILVVTGDLTVGLLVVVLNYLTKFLVAAKQLTHTNYRFKSQLGTYNRLFEILAMQPVETSGESPFSFRDMLRFDKVFFGYEESQGNVLKGVDLTIHQGEWVGVMGESGAGKTTLFDLLLRLYEPQSGEITVDGVNFSTIDCQDLRRKITKVSQDTFLFPGTIRENLEMVNPTATEDELWKVLAAVRLDVLVQSLENGLDTDIGENGLLLSGGERQRLGLAQGLLRNSEVILLDEVTANVDAKAESAIMHILKDLQKERNITILSISHRVDFLECAQRIVVLSDGQIKEETTFEELQKLKR